MSKNIKLGWLQLCLGNVSKWWVLVEGASCLVDIAWQKVRASNLHITWRKIIGRNIRVQL
jgi:hypothetical protein